MNDRQITCFLEVAKHRSFSKAAQTLFLTQPTVTHQIASLEKELGFQLFNRDYHGVTLTPAGEHFADCMDSMSQQMQLAIQQSREIATQQGSSLIIGHYSPEGDNLFYQAVHTFTEMHEAFDVDIRLPSVGLLVTHLVERRLDAVLMPRSAMPPTDELCTAPLFSNPEFCVMLRRHPLASRSSLTLDDLRETTCLLGAEEVGMPWHAQQIIQRRAEFTFHSGHTTREMITNVRSQFAIMIAQYPLLFISDDLVRIPFSDGPKVETVLVWRRDNHKKALSAFLAFLPGYYADNR